MEIPAYNRLKGQVAIVTGSSSGLGKATVIQMAREGARVLVNHLTHEEDAREIASEIKDFGGEAIIFKADVSKEEDVKAMFSKAIETYGTVHILVNNAGIESYSTIEEMTLEQWQKVIAVNLQGTFLCTREAIKEFNRRGIDESVSRSVGRIICISSVHQRIPWGGNSNYAASKGGITQFMKSVAQEVAPYKIRVNSIAPGAIRTPINKDSWDTPEEEEKMLKLIPYNRIGDPLDIARAAVWLASDESDYVHGTTLFVDGGMTLYPSFAPQE
ncbi:MAG: SDR family oxidoreductase [Bacteroidales bacterium]